MLIMRLGALTSKKSSAQCESLTSGPSFTTYLAQLITRGVCACWVMQRMPLLRIKVLELVCVLRMHSFFRNC